MAKVHFRSYIHKKMILFPQRIDKDIAEDDPVRLLDALVDNLMLDNVYKLYKPSGRKPYHPQMMLKVILYAYMNNIYSCRRIESLLKRDIHFIIFLVEGVSKCTHPLFMHKAPTFSSQGFVIS